MSYPVSYNHARAVISLNVVSLFIQQTGTYNDQFKRPYVSHLDNGSLSNILNRVAEVGGYGKINSSVFSGYTSGLISPSPITQGGIFIPQGWGETRARFILTVQATFSVGNPIYYYIQGFTDYFGLTKTNIDPNMIFYINSVTAVANTTVMTPMGMQEQKRIIGSDLIIVDNSYGNNNYVEMSNSQYMLRPSDIFAGLHSTDVYNAATHNPTDLYIDRRTQLSNVPTASKRQNDIPTDYLASVANSYLDSKETADFNIGQNEILSTARQNVMENPISQNPFISALSSIYGVIGVNSFRMQDLISIDPNTDNVTTVNWIADKHLGELHYAGQTEHLAGADRTTTVAVGLGNSIPALMIEYLITNISFQATNNTVSGQPTVVIMNAQSITNADMTQYYRAFETRLINEIINDFTFNNSTSFTLMVDSNLFGDTSIQLSIDGGPLTPFVIPSFSESLFTSIITPNQESYYNIVNDMGTLLNGISEAKNNYGLGGYSSPDSLV